MAVDVAQKVPGHAGLGIYRRMFVGSGVYAVATFAGRFASFILLPLYTRYLTPTDYGVLELLELTLYVFGTLVGMRLGDALIYRWSIAVNDPDRQTTALSTAYWGAFLLAGASFATGWFLSPWLSILVFGSAQYTQPFRLMFSSFAASLPMEIALSYARVSDRASHYMAFSVARLVLTASLNVFFLVSLHLRFEAMLWSGLIASAALSLATGPYLLQFGRRLTSFQFSELRQILGYGVPLGIGGMGFLVMHYGDRFFLRQYATLADIGIYALAYKIGMLITTLQTPFDVYWRAQMFQIVKRPDGDRVYVRVCTYLTVVLMAFVVFLMVFSQPILRIMAGPAFGAAAKYVPWVALVYVIRTVGGHFRGAFLLEGKTQQDAAVVWLAALVCLACYALLIPRYLLWGAVAATGIAFTTMFAAGLWQAQRVRPFDFEYRRMLLPLLAAVPVAILHFWLPPQGMLLQIFTGCCLMIIYVVLLLATGFLNPGEKQQAVRTAGLVDAWIRGRLGLALRSDS